MPEKLTPRERILNRFFAIPTVAHWWARTRTAETQALVELSGAIPFAQLRKPLRQCTGALITTAGVHLRSQPPFDMENPAGDSSYREIPGTTADGQLVITHKYYDHGDADRDMNVVFPLDHFRDLAAHGVISATAPRHFGFMGHVDGPVVAHLTARSAPEVAAKLRADGVDFAFLTPA
jgi:D-proline reductase (dithiol) PrdB